MDFTRWMDTLAVELPRLWQCLKTNTFPAAFLTRGLGLSDEALARLPQWLTGFVAAYLVCGVLSLLLRYRRGQRPINGLTKQLVNLILTTFCVLLVPLLPMLVRAIPYVIQHEVHPLQGSGDWFRFFGDCFGQTFYLIMAVGAVAATIWLPLGGVFTYLKRYGLLSLPQIVFDYGGGAFLVSLFLLSSYHGQFWLYLFLIPGLALQAVLLAGGCLPEEVNSRRAVEEKR